MKKSIKKRWNLTVSLILFVFAVMMAAMLLAGFIFMVLHLTGHLSFGDGAGDNSDGGGALGGIFAMMLFSTVLGTAITAFFSKKALKPIRKVITATNRIAEGDFNVRIDIKGVYELEELSQSFNKMAHDLSSTETLRSNFINDFSHEFKTPIVSVRGFAKLLKDGNITEEEKQEYLDIIIAESERLAALSTNILNLSKFENIEIITGKAPFRLDEQIRRTVAMTEPKWSDKEININAEMEEITFEGNEDLTQQIWLNLLDNASKFSEKGGTIHIRLSTWNGGILFTIQDNGIGMDEKTKVHVFDKFYQGDTSRTGAGNGLGLAIVKRITELYGGRIDVQSELGKGSKMSVWLPQ